MTALATGIDLIEIRRLQSAVERHGTRFLERIFTSNELAEAGKNQASLAARFAAKEAVAKALGSGIGPVSWKEIEILRAPNGQPELRLYGAATQLAAKRGLGNWSLSLSHSHDFAIAIAVAVGEVGG